MPASCLLHACFMPASCLCKNYGITSLGAFPKISTLALDKYFKIFKI